jgi:nicotinate-nucleotide adenylyltransferase
VSVPAAIGILGGTFNPIHLAHLRAAEEVREAQRLDEIWLVPSAVPPHKPGDEVVAAAHRLRMVELAIDGVPGFRASAMELERVGASYSIDTLRAVRVQIGDDARVVFVVGYDAFRDLGTWKEHASIFGLCDVVVVTRPPWPETLALADIPVAAQEAFWYDSGSESFRHRSGHVLTLQRITGLDISAAAIRARVAADRSVRFLVPRPVEAYIAEHGLYRQEPHRLGDTSR